MSGDVQDESQDLCQKSHLVSPLVKDELASKDRCTDLPGDSVAPRESWTLAQRYLLACAVANEFVTLFGTTIIFATWPLIVSDSYGLTLHQVAIVIASWPAAAFCVTPIFPFVVGSLGVTASVLIGNVGSAISDLLFMETQNWVMMSCCHGIRGAFSSLAYNALLSYTSSVFAHPSQMCTCQAYCSAARETGSLIGQALGGVLFTLSYKAPFALAASAMLLTTVALCIAISNVPPEKVASPNESSSWLELARAMNWGTAAILGAIFIHGISVDGVTTTASIVLARRFDQGPPAVGLMIAGLAVCGIVINLVIAGHLKGTQEQLGRCVVLGLIVYAISMVFFAPLWSSVFFPVPQYLLWVLTQSSGRILVSVPRISLLQLHFAPIGESARNYYVPTLSMLTMRVIQTAGPVVWSTSITKFGVQAWAHGMAAVLLLVALGLAATRGATMECNAAQDNELDLG